MFTGSGSYCRKLLWLAALLALWVPGVHAQEDPEPNDTPGEALLLRLPFSSTYGLINSYADVDFYKFDAQAREDVIIWVQTAKIRSPLAAIVALCDATGSVLAYSEREWNLADRTPAAEPILYAKTTAAGTYYIAVTSRALFFGEPEGEPGEEGRYGLLLFKRFENPDYDDPNEPNDTRPTATRIALPYQSLKANLLHFGDVDWYRVTAKKGESVSIDVDALELAGTPGWEMIVRTRLGLFDDSGRLLAVSAAGRDPDSGFTDDPALTLAVPKDGNYFIAVASVLDEAFGQAYESPEFALDPEVRSSDGRIGRYRIRVRSLQRLQFPQFANGSFGTVSYATKLILLNPGAEAVSGSVSFFRGDGTGAALPLAFPEGSDAGLFVVPGRGSIVIRTDGSGDGVTGYATVLSTAPLGGSAVLSQFDSAGGLSTEAGVAAAAPMEFFTFPVDAAGGFNTGMAVANPQPDAEARLYLELVNSKGETVANRTLAIAAGGQASVFVSGPGQLFPEIGEFRGSLRVFSNLPVPAVALRSSAVSLTTLPVVPLNMPYQQTTLYIPQVVAGASDGLYRSTLVLANPGYFTVTADVRFTRSDGTPMALNLGAQKGAVHSYRLGPRETLFLESSTSEFVTGYATVSASQGIGATIIFSRYSLATGALETEVAVAAAPKHRQFLVFAEGGNGYETGVAMANVDPGAATVGYVLSSGEEQIENGPVQLEGGRHRAVLVSGPGQLFPGFSGSGVLQVSSTTPVPAMALRISATTMTALPVVPIP